MALKGTLTTVAKMQSPGWDDADSSGVGLASVLKQLRGFKIQVVAGATPGNAITVSPLVVADDHLISIVRLTVTGTAANFAEEVAGYTISTANRILGNSTNGASNSSGDRLLVVYYDFSAGA